MFVLACCAAGLQGAAALAQTQTADPVAVVIQKNRVLPGFRQALQRNFVNYEAGLSTQCKQVDLDWSASSARVLRHGMMLPSGQADGVQWEEKVPGKACGEAREYRALIVLRNGEGGIQPLLPGDGWAGPLLEHDTMLQVNAAAAVYTHDHCPVDVVHTHLASGTPSEDPKASWTETWTVHSCGKHFDVPITFTPDSTGEGTSMSVNASKIVSVP
ncbi:hypothetical protein GCM10022270_01040 [Terriglobus aquaticus]